MSEGTSSLEQHKVVTVGGLSTLLLALGVFGNVGLELCVHVPADLLGGSLRNLVLLLGHRGQGAQLSFQNFHFYHIMS